MKDKFVFVKKEERVLPPLFEKLISSESSNTIIKRDLGYKKAQ